MEDLWDCQGEFLYILGHWSMLPGLSGIQPGAWDPAICFPWISEFQGANGCGASIIASQNLLDFGVH